MECSVMWFRRDLRLEDNEAVLAATAGARNCLFIFVVDPWYYSQPNVGLLRVKFMIESLISLDESLRKRGNRLTILYGESTVMITKLLGTLKTNAVQPTLYVNYDIQGYHGIKRDKAVAEYCASHDITLHVSHNSFLLHNESKMDEWWRLYYEYQYADVAHDPAIKSCNPKIIGIVETLKPLHARDIVKKLNLTLPDPKQALFRGGEAAARKAVYYFLKDRVDGYRWKISRPYLAQLGATSLLGPHLAFGTISSRTVFQAAVGYKEKLEGRRPKKAFDVATYLDRLRWRDSFTQRLWFHPELAWKNRFPEFDQLYANEPLRGVKLEYFTRWQNGETGFPLLDAAMKQLRADGFINFRMRAMAVTFLTINCGVSWHHGARHFMNCLVDGDIAINHWQWQMQAGITNPLSPIFRMYSPTKNFHDRDGSADYVHFWLPETRRKSVENILKEAKPMLDFNITRKVNGKIVADIRKQVRNRILAEKGLDLAEANMQNGRVNNFYKRSADRYKRYVR